MNIQNNANNNNLLTRDKLEEPVYKSIVFV